MFEDNQQVRVAVRPVGSLSVDARATFIQRTYGHLLGAIVAFTLFEFMLFKMGWARGAKSEG